MQCSILVTDINTAAPINDKLSEGYVIVGIFPTVAGSLVVLEKKS